MSKEFDALLQKLAETADDHTIQAALMDVTVARPDAMEQLEEQVKTICRAGQMPEATAIRLVTQMREVAAKTVMRAPMTQVLQARSEVLEGQTELLAGRTEVLGAKTELLQNKADLLSPRTELLQGRSGETGDRTELLQGREADAGAKTEVLQGRAGDVGARTELLQGRAGDVGARTELLQGRAGDVGARTELLQGRAGDVGARTELLQGRAGEVGAKTELLQGRAGEEGARTELLQGRAGEVGARTELLQGRSGEAGARTEVEQRRAGDPGARTEMDPAPGSPPRTALLQGRAGAIGAATEFEGQAGVAPTRITMPPTTADAPPSTPAKTAQIPESVQRRRATDAAKKASDALGPGALLKDRYILKREIGRGGMGTVYAAEDRLKLELGNPEPMVAVKVLQPKLAVHTTALIALEREAAKAQTLAHPNVGTVFGFDRDGDVVFVTMELLTGSPLDEVIRNTNGVGIPRAQAMHILRGIAEGLAYAHAKGLVHADLKPSNIFLTEDNIPKILDLGIARAVPGANAKKDSFDVGKLGAYTAAYATAEMIEGNDPNKADDVYALGLIAYEMLTAKHPYQRVSAPEALKKGLVPKPIKGLSRREWGLIRSSIAFTRAERPADAAVFRQRLSGISRLQKALTAATLVLVLVAAYFGYARYEAAGPDPFDPARPQDKVDFVEKMKFGDEAWAFFEKGEESAWQDALTAYSEAYRKHPRDRDASRALRKLARKVLDDFPEQRTVLATQMAQKSPEYLATYEPVKKYALVKSTEDQAP